MENYAYIGLGSNMGDRFELLEKALNLLNKDEKIEVVNTSSIYETEPVGYTNQAPFLNMVVVVKTELGPFELLETTSKIEAELGRKRDIRWGPRTIDLDILLYNHENIISEKLTIPHPRMKERAFVMIPLLELDIDKRLDIWEDVSTTDGEGVRIWKRKNGEDVFALFEN